MPANTVIRPHAEQAYAHELEALAVHDDRPRPASWRLSPWAVVTYLLGGKAGPVELAHQGFTVQARQGKKSGVGQTHGACRKDRRPQPGQPSLEPHLQAPQPPGKLRGITLGLDLHGITQSGGKAESTGLNIGLHGLNSRFG